MDKITKDLQDARVAFDRAHERYQSASNDRTAALNRLNDAQKAFDAEVSKIRKDAPRDSDWQQSRNMGVSVA